MDGGDSCLTLYVLDCHLTGHLKFLIKMVNFVLCIFYHNLNNKLKKEKEVSCRLWEEVGILFQCDL